jgi:hypothetical protein
LRRRTTSRGAHRLKVSEPAVVRIGDRVFPYQRPWDGRPLTDRGYLALDTETEPIGDDRAIPRLALASASAGGAANCVVHPDQVGAFVLAHPRARWVFHNVAFDFWVVDRHLRENGEEAARAAWWDACDRNRMGDTMLLDQLIDLARRDADPRPRDLAVVGKQYARLDITKDDPYRLRYDEIIGQEWGDVEGGFFEYAVKDAIVTFHAYRKMVLEVQRLVYEHGRHSPDLGESPLARFGVLTESLQVKAAVALAAVTRRGMHLDLGWVQAAESELRARLDGAIAALRAICPGFFKLKKDRATGQTGLRLTAKAGTPSRSNKVLQEQLVRVAAEVREETGQDLSIPRITTGLSQSVKVWSEYGELHPFLRAWISYEGLAKLSQFFAGLRDPVVHPDYRGLVRTGRASCSGPNIQQIPRDSQFRQAFVPAPGHLLLAVDYAAIELRTLAAVCVKRYGRSVLADVIKRGVDPHAYTASMILGVPLD